MSIYKSILGHSIRVVELEYENAELHKEIEKYQQFAKLISDSLNALIESSVLTTKVESELNLLENAAWDLIK